MLDLGFRELGLHRIWADCDPANTASWRVLEKNGLRREGHLRENASIKGQWVDSLIYAVLSGEWMARPSASHGDGGAARARRRQLTTTSTACVGQEGARSQEALGVIAAV